MRPKKGLDGLWSVNRYSLSSKKPAVGRPLAVAMAQVAPWSVEALNLIWPAPPTLHRLTAMAMSPPLKVEASHATTPSP